MTFVKIKNQLKITKFEEKLLKNKMEIEQTKRQLKK